MTRRDALPGMQPLLTIEQVAERAGWPYRKMLRHLLAQDRELGGMLLVKEGRGRNTRYHTTAAALRQIHPQWFVEQESIRRDVDEHEERIEELDGMVVEVTRQLGAVREEVANLRKARSA